MRLRGNQVPLPDPPLVHQRFEEQAAATPDAVAVAWGEQRLTYAQLDARSNRFAQGLMERNIAPGALIGICMDYSPDLLVAILGTLKAGAAYVPLDPAYPAARLDLLLAQIPETSLVVATEQTAGLVAGAATEVTDVPGVLSTSTARPAVEISGNDLCYAVFTSGSTGTPKLTAVRHENWFNLLNWLTSDFGMHRGSHNLVVSAFGFDLSQRSLLMPLFCGATQYLMPSRNFDAAMAYRLLGAHDIRVLNCASSTLYLMVDWETACGGETLGRLDSILFGGEPLRLERLRAWAQRENTTCRLLHQYGVAECADVASSFDISGYDHGQDEVPPVGRPGFNTDLYLVDETLREVGEGERGEICIAGRSVGAGYLNASDQDSGRFTSIEVDGVPQPVYRTGDRGFVNSTGDLVVLGRIDAQIKVRGMRIDPADIERALVRLGAVHEAAVVNAEGRGSAELVAFVVPSESVTGQITEKELRTQLSDVLPRTMVPAAFVSVAQLPLSPHGKVDRVALLETLRERRQVTGGSR